MSSFKVLLLYNVHIALSVVVVCYLFYFDIHRRRVAGKIGLYLALVHIHGRCFGLPHSLPHDLIVVRIRVIVLKLGGRYWNTLEILTLQNL